ncbi:MAG: hypothetical protein WDN67_04095 [Candidatus Moraniibacteriota bacterium]
MWNPFTKNPEKAEEEEDELAKLAAMPGMPDTKDMGVLQKFAMKRLAKMSPEERQKTMQKAMTPKNIAKHKDEIISSLEAMRKSGQISDDQYRLAKKRFGL